MKESAPYYKSDSDITIAIILPAYNEELTIKETIESFHEAIPSAELYIIDNNSTDKTNEIARRVFNDKRIKGEILFEPWQGKGNAIRRAFSEIDADIYIMSDADNTYPSSQIYSLIDPIINDEADVVIGDRLSGGDYIRENERLFHNFGNRLVVSLVNFVGKVKFADVMSGYRAMNKTFVYSYPLTVSGFQLETDLSLFAAINRFRVKEIPIKYKNRPKGSTSKLNTYRDGIRVLVTIFNIFRHYNPLFFFSMFALLFALLSLSIGVPVIYEYISTGIILHIPSAILASGLGIFSIISLGVGLVLDSLAYFNRNITFIQRSNIKRKNKKLSKVTL